MELSRELALQLVYDFNNGEFQYKLEKIDDIPGDLSRWTQHHQLIVKDKDGKYWAADYEVGLTEYQDTEPWEYENTVKFYEVERVPVETFEYIKKN